MMSNRDLIKKVVEEIQRAPLRNINIMEVCGTHTQAISRFGIRQLVEPNLRLLSGPGCPVCVTPESYMDAAVELCQNPKVIIATFGDMMKVNGSSENLIAQREKGKDIRVVYSPLDPIKLAEENKDKEVVFLGVGFETTTPLIALTVKKAKEKDIGNLSFLIGMKRMEPILHHMLSDPKHNIQGVICPGHVAAVKGEEYFKFITEQYNIPAVIAGFEAADIIGALYFLMKQQGKAVKNFKNLYKTCVTPEGNIRAIELMEEVFAYCDGNWRGIGSIKASGLCLQDNYKKYNAAERFGIKVKENVLKSCVCGEVLLGRKLPVYCEFFGRACTPDHAIGPSMVSSEGACSVFYKYTGR